MKIKDIHEFLQLQLKEHQYKRLLALIELRKDFHLSFKLKHPINDIENVTIFMKNNRFVMQFIPKDIENSSNFDKIAPDSIIFIKE